jgi:hypothetical protein
MITQYIIFQTHGKIINPEQCRIVFNSNEIGQQVYTELIKSIERVYNEGTEKNLNCWESISMSTLKIALLFKSDKKFCLR